MSKNDEQSKDPQHPPDLAPIKDSKRWVWQACPIKEQHAEKVNAFFNAIATAFDKADNNSEMFHKVVIDFLANENKLADVMIEAAMKAARLELFERSRLVGVPATCEPNGAPRFWKLHRGEYVEDVDEAKRFAKK